MGFFYALKEAIGATSWRSIPEARRGGLVVQRPLRYPISKPLDGVVVQIRSAHGHPCSRSGITPQLADQQTAVRISFHNRWAAQAPLNE